ncbi:MAG: ribosome-associated translation inhibitor RaiA [Candidatus Paceibacterota bacterium]|jgi:putative sigma-54 modulation protein
MIQKLEINGVHTVLTDDLKKYITKKIGKLDRYMPRHARESAHAEVFVKEIIIKAKKENVCEVVLHLPGTNLMTKEATINMFAAVDIVEAKLKNQLKKYKETHSSLRIHRRVLLKLRRSEA